MNMSQKRATLYLFLFGIFFIPIDSQVHAAISSCTASVNPSAMTMNSTNSLDFTVTNQDANNSIKWVRISKPNGVYFTILSAADNGWSRGVNDQTAVFTSSSHAIDINGASGDFILSVQAGSSIGSYPWKIEAADVTFPSSPTICTVNSNIGITQPLTISSISVNNITGNSATVTWGTSVSSDGTVAYGTSSYTDSESDSSMTTSHVIHLTNLSPNTTYHYQITSKNQSDNAQSGDNTFVTGDAPTPTPTSTPTPIRTPTPTVAQVSNTITSTPTPTLTVASPSTKSNVSTAIQKISKPIFFRDTTPPTINITTDLSKPFTSAPTIKGRVVDDIAINKIQYSMDNGNNWLPVTMAISADNRVADFQVLMPDLYDGNYQVKLRAEDAQGNTSLIAKEIVINALPPEVGTSLVYLGPQVITPRADGILYVPAGIDQQVILSAIGGPVTVDLSSHSLYSPRDASQTFSLRNSEQVGLWKGTLNIRKPGLYRLDVTAIDGANSKVNKILAYLRVIPYGVVLDQGKPVQDAEVSLYTVDPINGHFELWDAGAYGQKNPQTTTDLGAYTLYPPAGTYYIEVKKKGYRTSKTDLFTISDTISLNDTIRLSKREQLHIGGMLIAAPDLANYVPYNPHSFVDEKTNIANSSLIAQNFPTIDYSSTEDKLNNKLLKNNYSLITFLNTWMPSVSTEMEYLNKLKARTDDNVFVIVPQESQSTASLFQSRGNYEVPVFADVNGVLIDPLQIHVLPTHYLVDSDGKIRKIFSGVYTDDELLQSINSIQ